MVKFNIKNGEPTLTFWLQLDGDELDLFVDDGDSEYILMTFLPKEGKFVRQGVDGVRGLKLDEDCKIIEKEFY